MPRSKRISEESSASGQVSAASADDEAVEQGPPIEVEDETGDESIPEEAWEEGAAEAEEPEADFEMVTCEDEGSGKVADVFLGHLFRRADLKERCAFMPMRPSMR